MGAAASNSLASQSRSIRSHSPRGFRQLTDRPRPANVTNSGGGDPNETQNNVDYPYLLGTGILVRSAQRTLTVIVLELPAAPLPSVTVSFALKLPVLV